MKTENAFEKKLELLSIGNANIDIRGISHRSLSDVKDAAIFVTDTLDLCWASAQAVFEDKATPEVAVAIYDRLISQITFKKENDL